MPVAPIYTIKNLKTFRSNDGGGFNASLYRDGTKVADVDDEGNGGSLMFHWLDHKAPRVALTRPSHVRTAPGATYTRHATPEEARLLAYADTLPPIKAHGLVIPEDEETVVSSLVADHEFMAKARRAFKTKVVGIQGDAMVTVNRPPTPENIARVRAQHPAITVVSDLPVDDALAMILAASKTQRIPVDPAPAAKRRAARP